MSKAQSLKQLKSSESGVSLREDGWWIDPRKIKVLPEFNTRTAFVGDEYYEQPEVKSHIRRIADSYIAGNYVDPIVVQVIDDDLILRHGHCRHKALQLAISEGHEIKAIRAMEHAEDEIKNEILTLTANDGYKLTPLAVGVTYSRLIAFGHTKEEIAAMVGKTAEHVKQCLQLNSLPIELKRMIQLGQIAATYAANLFKKHGHEKSVEIAKEILASMNASPDSKKTRLKQSVVEKGPRMTRKVFSAMQSCIGTLAVNLQNVKEVDGRYVMELTSDQVEQLKQVTAQVIDPADIGNAEAEDKDTQTVDMFESESVESVHTEPPATTTTVAAQEDKKVELVVTQGTKLMIVESAESTSTEAPVPEEDSVIEEEADRDIEDSQSGVSAFDPDEDAPAKAARSTSTSLFTSF